MWNIELRKTLSTFKLVAKSLVYSSAPGINEITIYNAGSRVHFSLVIKDSRSPRFIKNIKTQLKEPLLFETQIKPIIINKNPTTNVLVFSVSTKYDSYAFSNVLKVLEKNIIDFTQLKSHIPYLMREVRSKVSEEINNSHAAYFSLFEHDPENIMNSALFISSRESELKLRDRYDFYDLPGSYNENIILQNLISRLTEIRKNLLAAGYLSYRNSNDPVDIIASSKTINILNNILNHADRVEVDQAIFAFNLNVALSTLMANNYVLKSSIALLWHCCISAAKQHSFMPNVTQHNAVIALVSGIANGVRGGNRDNDDGVFDDLDYNFQVCDTGKYNELISAFNGIFAEVNIVYSYIDLFIEELKSYIIDIILNHKAVNSYADAEQILNTWLGHKNIVTPQAYFEIVAEANKNFSTVCEKFINSVCVYEPINKTKLKAHLDNDIARMHNTGFSYIEIVSPTHEQLKSKWDLNQPRPTSRRRLNP